MGNHDVNQFDHGRQTRLHLDNSNDNKTKGERTSQISNNLFRLNPQHKPKMNRALTFAKTVLFRYSHFSANINTLWH